MKATILVMGILGVLGMEMVEAQRGGGEGRGGRNRDEAIARREFESVRGEFEAWKASVLQAGSLKNVVSENQQAEAGAFYDRLGELVLNEELPDSDFRELGQDYIRFILAAKSKGERSFVEGMDDLRKRVEEKATGTMDAATATPEINREQVLTQEMLWWGILSQKASKGKQTTIVRKQTALENLEAKAKADGKVEERERERLKEEAGELRQELMEALGG
ncbi:MAG: hypothetical protein AAGC74_14340 [Verrucomicrobiota bacterium]